MLGKVEFSTSQKASIFAFNALGVTISLGFLFFSQGQRVHETSQIALNNPKTAAVNFEINRRVLFYNEITDKYFLSIEGKCSTKYDGRDRELEVTCKTGFNQETGELESKIYSLCLSDNISYIVEDLEPSAVSSHHYRVTYMPQPDIDFRGSLKDLSKKQK